MHHESWRDEAFVWLIARELPFSEIWNEVRYHGAVSLWYYLAVPLARSGLPYESLQYLHWLVAIGFCGVFLRFSPFHPLIRLVCIFSYYFLYEHAVIARPYALSMLCIFTACATYAARFTRPWPHVLAVALLAHTNFFGTCAALFFTVDWLLHHPGRRAWLEGQRPPALLLISALLAAMASFIPPEGAADYYAQSFTYYRPEMVERLLMHVFAPWSQTLYGWVGPSLVTLAVTGSVLIFLSSLALLLRGRAWLLAAFLCAGWGVVIYITVWKYAWPAPRHFSYCVIYTLMALWLAHAAYPALRGGRPAAKLLAALLLLSFSIGTIPGVQSIARDYGGAYSASQAMAAYIRENGLEKDILINHYGSQPIAMLAYLPPHTRIWVPNIQRFMTYPHYYFPGGRDRYPPEKIMDMANLLLPKDKPLYLVSERWDLKSVPGVMKLTLLHSEDGFIEKLHLYRMEADTP